MSKPRRAALRQCVARLYETNGSVVEEIRSRGILPGSLLTVSGRKVAVRTSLDREFSVTRRSDGTPATITSADEVAVVTPCSDNPKRVEVFLFEPSVITEAFGQTIAARRVQFPTASDKGPVFIGLDTLGPDGVPLSEKARWKDFVAIEEVDRKGRGENETLEQFRRRVHREFAELLGVAESEVAVELRILPIRV